jgi:hypothetical protein
MPTTALASLAAAAQALTPVQHHYIQPPLYEQIHMPMMSSHRLFRFPKPQWLNSANSRTFGVYAAGALVRFPFFHLPLSR